MRTQIILLLASIVGFFLITGCEGIQSVNNKKTTEADTMLIGPTWQMKAFVKANGDHIALGSVRSEYAHAYTVVFTNEIRECSEAAAPCGKWNMKVTGYPNSGGFSYNIDPNESQALTIFFHGQTKIGLPEGSKEPDYFNALNAASDYQINGKQLRIFYNDAVRTPRARQRTVSSKI